MAAVLAEMPDLWHRALEEHAPDANGQCMACRDDGTRAQWPCLAYQVAEQARDIFNRPRTQVPRPRGRHGSL
ncbi:MAG: hypothetical protein ACRDRL_32550 [Sciscionella sp.]